jgi:hypothetical protein
MHREGRGPSPELSIPNWEQTISHAGRALEMGVPGKHEDQDRRLFTLA